MRVRGASSSAPQTPSNSEPRFGGFPHRAGIFALLGFAMVFLAACDDDQKATVPSPTGVTATAGDGQVTVAWEADETADSHTVYWATAAGASEGRTAIPEVTTPFDHTGLTNGTTYYYVVTATVGGEESGPSEEVSATPALAVPAAPTSVAAVAGNALVAVSWDTAADADSYNVYWATASGSGTAGTLNSDAAAPFVHTGLTNGTTYFYVVTAVNAAGESDPSDEVSATPAIAAPTAVPPAPTGVTASAGASQVTVSWTAAAGADTYRLYWSTATGTGTAGTAIPVTSPPFLHTGLTNGTTYYYVVTAVNAVGESDPSEEVSATPSAEASASLLTVGGTVSGLAGTGLVLQNNGGDDLAISANGTFTFPTALADESGYAVTVLIQPTSLSQTCTVSGGNGTLAGANVTTVAVSCATGIARFGSAQFGQDVWQ